ncbi:MAG: xanthine dehydrogenase small subunit [Woeseia sp.]
MTTLTPAIDAPTGGTVRFVLDGERIEVPNADPTRTVLQFLREDLHRIGTKEGCAEGDCGACTVVVAELERQGGDLCVRAINSCIQFLPTLDGKELITVESLRGADGTLHPVQQAMVDCHGSQCGFCTPGFVMSLFALYKNNASPSRRDIDDALAGNLCRCTGYNPIIKAAQEMYRVGAARGRPADWLTTPCGLAANDQADAHKHAALLRSIERTDTLAIEYGDRKFFAPRNVRDMARLAAQHPDATILSGGTDVGLWVSKQMRELKTVIYSGNVEELKRVSVSETHIDVGAAVTLTDAMPAILAHYPELEELLLRFASPPIRNAATLGGNIANGSPIGDSMPALLALDTVLVLRHGDKTRELPLAEFYLAYQKTARMPGELLERVLIPLPEENTRLRSYKVSKRFDQDISAVCGAYRITLDESHVADARIAYGGLAEIPGRAPGAERELQGGEWNEQTVKKAMAALDRDFAPLSDMRSSSAYRRRVARNLLYRFYLETSGAGEERVYDYGRQKLA